MKLETPTKKELIDVITSDGWGYQYNSADVDKKSSTAKVWSTLVTYKEAREKLVQFFKYETQLMLENNVMIELPSEEVMKQMINSFLNSRASPF